MPIFGDFPKFLRQNGDFLATLMLKAALPVKIANF
jgi:hypothetical protein